MTSKTTIALALAAGFMGGIASQRLVPAPVLALQAPASIPQELRTRKFVLVDEAGVSRGVFGFDKYQRPSIELMDAKGHTWGFALRPYNGDMLPDATCLTCPRKPGK